jgi:hypothetical protein
MTGAAEAGLRGAIEYTKNREAFGVPIGTFQALQHMTADAYVALCSKHPISLPASRKTGSNASTQPTSASSRRRRRTAC